MYAIVEIAGRQVKVSPEARITAPRLSSAEGETVRFDKVLLVADEAGTKVGTPQLKGASVSARVLGHAKGDTVIVFKKKRRKGYVKKNGHRQGYSKLLIESISA
jgi:large subunit ribosomal protein L21